MPQNDRNLPVSPRSQNLQNQDDDDKPEMTPGEKLAALSRILDKERPQIETLIVGRTTFDLFKQVVILAVRKNEDLLLCTPKSMMDACMECANAGLSPDGKEAALVPFRGVVQFLPMVKGIIIVLNRTGIIRDVQTDVVYTGEFYVNMQGTDSRLEHSPKLGERGGDDAIEGAYAVIRTLQGGIYKRAISRSHINKVRAASKANKGPWFDWFGEMAQKTALKNAAKLLPFSDLPGGEKVQALLDRDNFLYDMENKPAIPAQRTVALAANPEDRIEDEPVPGAGAKEGAGKPQDGDDTPRPNDTAKKTRKAAGKPQEQPQQPSGDDGKPKLSEAGVKLRQWVMDQITKMKTAEDLQKIMVKAWEHAAWPEIETAGLHKPLYDIIRVTEPFEWLPADSDVVLRIKKG